MGLRVIWWMEGQWSAELKTWIIANASVFAESLTASHCARDWQKAQGTIQAQIHTCSFSQEPKRTRKAKKSHEQHQIIFWTTLTGTLPNKTRVSRQIAPECSLERSAKSLSHSFFVVPFLSPIFFGLGGFFFEMLAVTVALKTATSLNKESRLLLSIFPRR